MIHISGYLYTTCRRKGGECVDWGTILIAAGMIIDALSGDDND